MPDAVATPEPAVGIVANPMSGRDVRRLVAQHTSGGLLTDRAVDVTDLNIAVRQAAHR